MRRGGGLITKEDLRATVRCGASRFEAYRGYSYIAMPPSSSGGVTMTETLNILETYGRAPFGSAR